jgi:hypothetical protein
MATVISGARYRQNGCFSYSRVGGYTEDAPMTIRGPCIVATTLCVGTVARFAAAEDVWALWLRTPDGTYNILTAGPTHTECLAVLDKLWPTTAPGESLRCLPKTVDPRESMEPRRPKEK